MTQEKYEAEFKYLERLRKIGTTNMYGARPYLAKRFSITKEQAGEILSEWMKRYDELAEKYGWSD